MGPAEAVAAARRNALLHELFLASDTALERLSWLEREGYAAHAHHVPAAHHNLERLSADRYWSHLLTEQEGAALHRALDITGWAVAELRKLPPTLIHGDFHISNLGFDPDGTLVAIDWAHVGIASLGCDVATLLSVYTGMGGQGEMQPGSALERDIIAAYCDALEGIRGVPGSPELRAMVHRTCGLWHLTWGLHLRLGPGLTALLRRKDPDTSDAGRHAEDIRVGCLRALRFLVQA